MNLDAKKAGLIAGPTLAMLVFFVLLPDTIGINAKFVGAMVVWMAIWWATEVVNVSVTALLPLGVFPLFGVSSMADTAAN